MRTMYPEWHPATRRLPIPPNWRILAPMPNPHDDPAALKALQDDIYRRRVLRARGMTEEERLAEVFELSNHQFGMMLGGAMARLGTTDEAEGWAEVRRWMRRLDRVRDHGMYQNSKPALA